MQAVMRKVCSIATDEEINTPIEYHASKTIDNLANMLPVLYPNCECTIQNQSRLECSKGGLHPSAEALNWDEDNITKTHLLN